MKYTSFGWGFNYFYCANCLEMGRETKEQDINLVLSNMFTFVNKQTNLIPEKNPENQVKTGIPTKTIKVASLNDITL